MSQTVISEERGNCETPLLMLRGVLVVAINKRVVLTVNYLHGQRLT